MKRKSKIMKTSLAVLVASSISLPSSIAFANTNDENFDSIKMEQENSTSNKDVVVNDEAMLDSAKNEVERLKESTESPSLLPGDFFYFAKLAIEKIQLAFTMDDAKEAKLLAGYAAERLAEVEALFKDGKQEKAIDALNNAIEMIQQSEDQWSDNDESDKDSTDEASIETDSDMKDESKMEKETDDTTSEDATVEDSVKEEEANSDDYETTEKSDEMTKMEEMRAQNILSLKANLEKVKNPKAKAALQRNIEKSYMKLAEKLAKLEEKVTRTAEEKESEEKESEEIKLNNTKTAIKESSSVKIEKHAVEGTSDVQTPETTEVREETASPVKEHVETREIKNEWKSQHKEAKKEAKEARKQEKKDAREIHHEKKDEKKQHTIQGKENRQHREKAKGNGNGKGHHKD
ncbi:DUF5667 domain-containing protein [Rossellomorea arthrocnemi]|uniref:DUF5667 domain-containing protein n=1 Tax=Rossellomorea arthrocnemi TaxID=2769542 RepID=UPI00191B6461|nr:hypothetical protein [Rossellomorea arthrocnemi]